MRFGVTSLERWNPPPAAKAIAPVPSQLLDLLMIAVACARRRSAYQVGGFQFQFLVTLHNHHEFVTATGF
jgi:hypothetical protein